MKKIQIIALVAGMALFVYLIRRIGLQDILQSIERVGFNFAFLLLVSGVKHVVRTVAWMQCIRERPQPIGMGELFTARVAGEAVRFISFTGPLLGEPSKAALIRHRLSLVQGFSSVLVEYFSYTLTSVLVTFIGLVAFFLTFTVPGSVQTVGLIVGVLLVLLTWFCYRLVSRRWMGLTRLFGYLKRRTGRQWFTDKQARVGEIEESVYGFFRRYRGRWVLILLLDLAAHLLGIFEIYLVLLFLGYESGFMTALIVATMNKIVNGAFFFVPGQVGVYEGGQALLFSLLGYAAAAGVALALIEKVRSLFWTAVGMLVLVRYVLNGKSAVEDPSPADLRSKKGNNPSQSELASEEAHP